MEIVQEMAEIDSLKQAKLVHQKRHFENSHRYCDATLSRGQ